MQVVGRTRHRRTPYTCEESRRNSPSWRACTSPNGPSRRTCHRSLWSSSNGLANGLTARGDGGGVVGREHVVGRTDADKRGGQAVLQGCSGDVSPSAVADCLPRTGGRTAESSRVARLPQGEPPAVLHPNSEETQGGLRHRAAAESRRRTHRARPGARRAHTSRHARRTRPHPRRRPRRSKRPCHQDRQLPPGPRQPHRRRAQQHRQPRPRTGRRTSRHRRPARSPPDLAGRGCRSAHQHSRGSRICRRAHRRAPSPGTASEPPSAPTSSAAPQQQGQAGEDDQEKHHDLLRTAAGIAQAEFTCHRDLWAFFLRKAANEPHFHVPGKVRGEDGRVRATLSGPTLLATLTAMWDVRRQAREDASSSGDWALSHELYEAVADAVGHVHGTPRHRDQRKVTIVIDRRPGQGDGEE